MGATIDAALFDGGRAHLAHVGDGSIYRFRQGILERFTTAHTLANECRRARADMTEAELAGVPKDVLVRALGMSPEVARLSDEAIGVILTRGGPRVPSREPYWTPRVQLRVN